MERLSLPFHSDLLQRRRAAAVELDRPDSCARGGGTTRTRDPAGRCHRSDADRSYRCRYLSRTLVGVRPPHIPHLSRAKSNYVRHPCTPRTDRRSSPAASMDVSQKVNLCGCRLEVSMAAGLLDGLPLRVTQGRLRMAKEDRGFASMDRARQREIASKGGRAAHARGTAHEWTSEEAREAGRAGGLATRRRRAQSTLADGNDFTGSAGRQDATVSRETPGAADSSSMGGGPLVG